MVHGYRSPMWPHRSLSSVRRAGLLLGEYGVSYLGKKKKARIAVLLSILWGWAERLEAVSADQAAKEIKGAVVAIKEATVIE